MRPFSSESSAPGTRGWRNDQNLWIPGRGVPFPDDGLQSHRNLISPALPRWREGTSVLTVVENKDQAHGVGDWRGAGRSLLDEIVRDGARQMLAAALQVEVAAYVGQFVDQVDEHGHRLVVRNGYHDEREVLTAAGAVNVKAPRVNDRRVDPDTGERQRFSSAILPAWARKSPQMAEVLPLLYLHGLSSGDFGPALEQFLGSGAGLSASAITRLTGQWQDEAKSFQQRDLSGVDYVYLWVDGIHLKVRLDQEKLCLLVMIGVRADGRKELVALTDGYRESAESWADLLRGCRRRGMTAPVLAVGDGALGFWKALRGVFPDTREQRCWWHYEDRLIMWGGWLSAEAVVVSALKLSA
jgi:putative transposase